MRKKNYFLKAIVVTTFLVLIGTNISPSVHSHVTPLSLPIPNQQKVDLTVNHPAFTFGKTLADGKEYATIELADEGVTAIVGEAQLPTINYLVEIPYGSNPTVRLSSLTWDETSLNDLRLPSQIVPVQPSVLKIPGATEKFVINNEYYATQTFLPNEITKIIEIGELRGRRFASIELSPIQYNPVSGALKLMSTCTITVDLPGSNMVLTAENIQRYLSPAFEDLARPTFVNYDSYQPLGGDSPRTQTGYLIIVYDSFYNAMLPFASWKQSIGDNVTVTKTSQIPGGVTKEKIKLYIKNAYNNWSTPPTYVLLVGDTGQIPTWTGTVTGTCTDLYYVTMTTPDYFPDIFIGRFPAATAAQVTNMVDKTIYYEAGNFSSNAWIKKAAFMASNDNYQISEGTHNYVINTYLIPHGYTCDKLYCHTYGATTQQVKNALNNGRSLAIYSGHGSTTSWADGPPFSQADVNSLTNTGMYPFVCSHACLTGQFTVSECFGETWVRAPSKAGLAFWGASTNTYWDEDDILEKKMFYAWWVDNLETIGGMTDKAKYYLYQYYGGGGSTKYYFEAYNVLGDPSIKIWRDNPPVPPTAPTTPSGPTQGIGRLSSDSPGGVTYTYTTTSTNQGNDLYYKFFWGDGTDSGWVGPYISGQTASASHDWNALGSFLITAKVKAGASGLESTLSNSLTVTMYLLGDVNNDMAINIGDINPFVLALSGGETAYYNYLPNGYYYTADCNLDGAVNFGDINPFVALLTGS